MYNLIEYSNNYSKKSESLWQYKIKIVAPLKYLTNFWRTLEMSLINCEINPILTSSEKCFISSATGETKFAITDTKLYVPIVNSSAQGNAKLLEQLKSEFKRTIN